MKIKGVALIFAIVVLVWSVIITSSLIMFFYIRSLKLEEMLLRKRLINNAISGISLMMSENYLKGSPVRKTIDLYDEARDSITVTRENWGAFEVISSTSFHKNIKLSKSAMVGHLPGTKSALYLCDNGKPLSVSGNTRIAGPCFLPKSGVKVAYIEGQTYNGTQTIYGPVTTSAPHLNPIKENFIEILRANYDKVLQEGDSLYDLDYNAMPETLVVSFSDPKIILSSTREIYLGSAIIKGHVVIRSDISVVISEESYLEDVIVQAPAVRFLKNSKVQVQAFASDSVIIDESSVLKYPSVISLMNNKKDPPNLYLKIGDQVSISGVVLANSLVNIDNSKIIVTAGKSSEITGRVYSYGSIDLKGAVHGSVYTNKIILKTPSSIYENHLLNTEIDISKLPEEFVSVSVIENNEEKKIAKWLY